MKIAVDWDGTCVRAMDLVCHLINFRHGTNYTARDVEHWDWWHDNGHAKDFWDVYDLMDRSGLRRFLEPYDRMTGPTLSRLSRRFTVDIVTANKPAARRGILRWLDQHAPLHQVRRVRCVGRNEPKATLDYDLFVDDGPHLAFQIAADHPGKQLLLANARWNECVPDDALSNVTRFHSWDQLPQHINQAIQ